MVEFFTGTEGAEEELLEIVVIKGLLTGVVEVALGATLDVVVGEVGFVSSTIIVGTPPTKLRASGRMWNSPA